MFIHGHNVYRDHEANTGDAWYEPHLLSLQVFRDTEHNPHQLGAEDGTPKTHTHAHVHTHAQKWIWITNEWRKMMMTNNYVLQGQKYTNGTGAVPQRMMGSPSDICSLQMARHTLSSVSSWSEQEQSASLWTVVPMSGRNITVRALASFSLHQKWCYTANNYSTELFKIIIIMSVHYGSSCRGLFFSLVIVFGLTGSSINLWSWIFSLARGNIATALSELCLYQDFSWQLYLQDCVKLHIGTTLDHMGEMTTLGTERALQSNSQGTGCKGRTQLDTLHHGLHNL